MKRDPIVAVADIPPTETADRAALAAGKEQVARSIVRNTSVLMGSQVITWASSFVLMMFLPRYLGSVQYGRLYLAVSIGLICQMVIDFGGQYFIAKEVARTRETGAATPSLVANVLAFRVALWGICFLMLLVFTNAIGYSPVVTTLILILGVARLWEGATRALVGCFQGFEMMQFPVLGAVTERAFITVAGVAALLLGADAVVIAALMAVSMLLHFLVIVRCTPRILPPLPEVDWTAVFGLMKAGLPYFLWSLFAVIYYRVDAVMLSLWTPEAVVGWYGAAYRFFDVCMFLPSIVASTALPVLSRLWGQERHTLAWTTQKSLEGVLIAGIPISIGVFAFAEQIIRFFFGLEHYGPSVLILQIFASGLLLVYVDFILGTALFASDRQRPWTVVAFLAMILNPALNAVMIPYTQTHWGNGGIGAGLATLATEAFVMNAAFMLLPKGLLAGFRVGILYRCLGAGLAMIGVIVSLRMEGAPWVAQGMAGVAVYGLLVVAMQVVGPSTLAMIGPMLSFRKLKHLFLVNEGTRV